MRISIFILINGIQIRKTTGHSIKGRIYQAIL